MTPMTMNPQHFGSDPEDIRIQNSKSENLNPRSLLT